MLERPTSLTVRAEKIPDELKNRAQWVCWQYQQRAGKWTKVPINPHTGGLARSDTPATWASFAEALNCARTRRLTGVGFVFTAVDPYCGVDLDKCRDLGTGRLEPWAQEIIAALDSYGEVSPSGTGVKLFVRAMLPPGGNRKGRVELYDRLRFFTLTGHQVPGTPTTIEPRQAAIDTLHASLFATATPPPPVSDTHGSPTIATTMDDDALIARALAARNGGRFARLWAGDTSAYASPSEADAALCTMLAFWCGHDPDRIDRLFRRSALWRPKWDARHYSGGESYGAHTIAHVLARSAEVYTGWRYRPPDDDPWLGRRTQRHGIPAPVLVEPDGTEVMR